MNDLFEALELEQEEELGKKGTIPFVTVYARGASKSLYISAAASGLIKTDYVKIGKAGKYLVFHECTDTRGFKVSGAAGNGGKQIPLAGVMTKTGIRPEQLQSKTPLKTKDGFAVRVY